MVAPDWFVWVSGVDLGFGFGEFRFCQMYNTNVTIYCKTMQGVLLFCIVFLSDVCYNSIKGGFQYAIK